MYDGGIRTPYVVRWPEKIKPGTTSYHVSAFYDFLPTLCDLVGAKVPEGCDGISFLPTLTGMGTQKTHDFLYWEIHENGGLQAVLKDNWKLIRFNADKKEYRYELYNLNHDPGEQRNVAIQYPGKIKTMGRLLDQSHTKNARYPFVYETEIKEQ
jgi:arylsulfatase A-like enzyme